jgi:hypothetical protein
VSVRPGIFALTSYAFAHHKVMRFGSWPMTMGTRHVWLALHSKLTNRHGRSSRFRVRALCYCCGSLLELQTGVVQILIDFGLWSESAPFQVAWQAQWHKFATQIARIEGLVGTLARTLPRKTAMLISRLPYRWVLLGAFCAEEVGLWRVLPPSVAPRSRLFASPSDLVQRELSCSILTS